MIFILVHNPMWEQEGKTDTNGEQRQPRGSTSGWSRQALEETAREEIIQAGWECKDTGREVQALLGARWRRGGGQALTWTHWQGGGAPTWTHWRGVTHTDPLAGGGTPMTEGRAWLLVAVWAPVAYPCSTALCSDGEICAALMAGSRHKVNNDRRGGLSQE